MKRLLLLLIFPLLLCSSRAYAGWPIGKYHYLLAPSITSYFATNGWDKDRNYLHNTGQKFYAQSLGLFAARGVTRRLDLSLSVPITYQTITYQGFATHNVGFGDMQFGGNYVLINSKYANFTTLYAGAIIPLYTNSSTRVLGLGNIGFNTRLSNSGNITKKIFYNVDLGFAQYIGEDPPRQYSAGVTFGYLIDKYNQIGASINGIRSISENKTLSLNTFANHDYDNLQISANYGHAISKRVNINVAGFYTIAGRNTGQGLGGSLSLLVRLPNPNSKNGIF